MEIEIERQILKKVASAWQDYATTHKLASNTCVLASNFASKVLSLLDIDNSVKTIGATVFNRRGWELYGIPTKSLPDDAWSVHCSSRCTGPGFSGHVVVETTNFFLDLTSSSFERLERNLLVGRNLIVPQADITVHSADEEEMQTHRFFNVRDYCTFPLINGGTYSFFYESWNTSYQKSVDWEATADELGVGDVFEQIRRDIIEMA